MAVHSFRCQRAAVYLFVFCSIYFHDALALTSSVYQLDSEYSGANFFQGWDFYTGGDPTGGFVTYYSQGSAQLTGMVNASDTSPIYIGSDYASSIGSTQAAGRPSVRISTQRSWTHGLFIGDFNHAPGGICGTWPAFWTLGPNWPYNGEIDVMEGVNLLNYNAATLHASPNCTIAGDSRFMTGQLSNNNCAYYPGYNVGCGVKDTRSTSFGAGFNAIGGGVYAMQWTSDYIRVWFFPRGSIPSDIANGTPNPSSWGLPSANMQGSCIIDQKFQNHKLILNNAFCGEYAGAASVWNSTTGSCATSTGYSTCNAYVAAVPGAFQNAYWSINSIRVYQLADTSNSTSTGAPYIASNQPTQSTVSATSSSTPVPTTSLCPTYNFTVVQSGNYKYEIECGVNIGGSDLGKPYPSYSYTNFEGCVGGCTYWNTYNASNICGGVTYNVGSNACYWKRNVGSTPAQAGFNSARLIYYAYPQVTDDSRSQTATTSTAPYVATSVTPNYYAPSNATTTTPLPLITETPTANITDGGGMGGGVSSTDDSSSTDDATSSQALNSTTTSRHSYTGPRTRTSSTTATTALASSTSSLTTTQATTVPTTSPVPFPSSLMLTTSTTTIPTSVQLSPPGSLPSTSSSSTFVVPLASSSASTVSTSTQTTSSPSGIPLPSSALSSSPGIITSSLVSQAHSLTTASTGATLGVTIQTSLSLSVSPTPSGSSSSHVVVPSSTASSSVFPLSSSAFSLPPPLPSSSSTVNTGSATSPPLTLITSAPPPPGSSVPPSHYTSPQPSSSSSSSSSASPSQQLDSTSNPPTVFSSAQIPPVSSGSSSSSTSILTSPPVSTNPIESTTEAPSSTTTTSETLPGPTEIVSDNGASFSFAGCLGPRPNTPFANSFFLLEDSPTMSIERCVSDCSVDVYAGLYDRHCYCSSYSLPTDMSEDFITYPVSACNTTCPGDPTQKCGGKVSLASSPSRFMRRQITNPDGDIILLTLYNNTAADAEISSSSTSAVMTTTTTTTSIVVTGGPDVGSTTGLSTTGLSTSDSGSASFSTPATSLMTGITPTPGLSTSASASASQTDNADLNSASTTSSVTTTSLSSVPSFGVSDILTSLSSSLSSSSSSSTPNPTLSPTSISTTYTTICALDPITCPTRTETCLTTTITVLHCGCTDTPVPEVPMTTTIVEACPVLPAAQNTQQGQESGDAGGSNGQNGEQGEQKIPMITLTVPCASEISSLEASVTSWSAAQATAHANVPYTFPMSFPMTSSAAAVTQTLNLVVATAPFNFSVLSVPTTPSNGTWYGEVKNMTVVPVALTAMGSASAGAATAGAGAGANVKSGASSMRRWGGVWDVGFVLLTGAVGLIL